MKLSKRILVGLALTMSLAIFPGTASAAHWVAQPGEPSLPGFSYFGRDHVASEDPHRAEGGNPGPHAGTSGASNCRDTTGSPSERAPGR